MVSNRYLMKELKIAVVGLGYVGLPLAVEFGKKYQTIGFDINNSRIQELNLGKDNTLELSKTEINNASLLSFSNMEQAIAECNIYIVTVPTPIDKNNRPDLSPLAMASTTIGKILNQGDIVIYESTVYPGATEEFCVPILEAESGLECNLGFSVGYSPERINPGDKEHKLNSIVKVTSGSNPSAAEFIDTLYASIIEAGTHKAESIKVAEAAKVIENTQRDVNIALINELAMLFNKLDVETEHVLKAAESKWNFLPFRPGLVGGHCIGVDPYYLAHKAREVGFHPEMTLAGRRINDDMGGYVATQFVKALVKGHIEMKNARILIMGLTFKENCPDLRNTRVVDIIRELKEYDLDVDVYDPWVDPKVAEKKYDINMIESPLSASYDGIILAVAHEQFINMSVGDISSFGKKGHVLYDLKSILPSDASTLRL